MITPIDWPQLVAEAIRRRKAEGLTQLAHADLAGVSKPVIIAFDKGEMTLSLGRALAILDVVGLVDRSTPHQSFVTAAQARWRELTATLPPDDPARFPLGRYEVDYEIEGVTSPPTAAALKPRLQEMMPPIQVLGRRTGLRPFWIPTRGDWQPRITQDAGIKKASIEDEDWLIEWWHLDTSSHALPPTPAESPFWRIAPKGHGFLTRGLPEDDPTLPNPGRYFDCLTPIQWAVAGLLHTAAMAVHLGAVDGAAIHFSTRYYGLSRRRLASFDDPGDPSFAGIGQSLSDRAELSLTTNAAEIRTNLSALVHRFLTPLYQRFDGFTLDPSFVAAEVARLNKGA